jgi:hypothetical protein
LVVAQVARGLRSGELTVDEGLGRLIDSAVEQHLGRRSAVGRRLKAELRRAIRGCVLSDPALAAEVRRLRR